MNTFSIISIVLLSSVSSQVTFTDLDTTLRTQLETAFEQTRNRALIASTVRLIFHDCAGQQERNPNGGTICDGCIDLLNPSHSGLESLAVEPLESIYSSWASKGLSRADFWAAAATIAIQRAQALDNGNGNDNLRNIPFYIGRSDCSASPDADINNGQYRLPYKSFPDEKAGWQDTLSWFQTNFGFDTTETIAIIGAHTLGRLHPQFSGYGSGRNGSPWVGGSDELDNNFYRVLLRRNWVQQLNAQGLHEWREGGRNNVYLNSDIALFKNIDGSVIDASTGQVSCTITTCPDNNAAIGLVQDYSRDNQLWLDDFADVFEKMIQTGYNNLQRL